MITMGQIRAQYPHPQVASVAEADPNGYCVGGAVCRVAFPAVSANFPLPSSIDDALQHLNPALTPGLAWAAACRITDRNDAQDFAGAWNAVEKALSVTREGA